MATNAPPRPNLVELINTVEARANAVAEFVAAEDGVGQRRNDGVLIADDAGIEFLAVSEEGDKVVGDLLLDGLRSPAASLWRSSRDGPARFLRQRDR